MERGTNDNELALVAAVRADPRIGRGSCSSIDECYTDEEIIEVIRAEPLLTKDQVLSHFFQVEGLRVEQMNEARAAGGVGDKPEWSDDLRHLKDEQS